MGIKITIPTKVIEYEKAQLDRWVNGERDDCMDRYCRNLPGSYGFGEYIVGQYFSAQGYRWIHHDFDVFGSNKDGKYPEAEEILQKCLGKELFKKSRILYSTFKPLEQPDLLIYKPDFSEIRFAESKRVATGDKIRESQVKGLVLISLFFKCKVEVFEVVEKGKNHIPQEIHWSFETLWPKDMNIKKG